MSKKIQVNQEAPNFSAIDNDGNEIQLSSYREKQPVLLAFNRGFM
ncbi:redoxin domain-containing protein [bacterium]|nr:redoxin domain-containing protein [bacterium]